MESVQKENSFQVSRSRESDRRMPLQSEEEPSSAPQTGAPQTGAPQTAIAPAGRLLFGLALMSYAFWLLHSFAIRDAFSAVRQLLLKSGLNR